MSKRTRSTQEDDMTETKPKTTVDLEFVKSLGVMGEHDINAVEAIYPGTFDKAVESVAHRFDDRSFSGTERETVKRHIGALVIKELKKKRGELDEQNTFRIATAITEAEEWLASSKSITEAREALRASAAPPVAPTELKTT